LKSWYAVCFCLALLFPSCRFGIPQLLWGEEDADSRCSSLTTLDAPDVGSNPEYSIVIISDVHFGADETRRDDAFLSWFSEQLDSSDETLRPRFVVCLGDTADTGSGSQLDSYTATLVTALKKLGTEKLGVSSYTVYTILGNHDLYNNGWSDWKKKIYPHTSYYRFNTQASAATAGFGWYFLDCANGTLGNDQLEDFEDHVNDDSRPKVVFTHYPVYCGGVFFYTMQNTLERNRLITAFADNNVRQVFEGHAHRNATYSFGSFQERIIDSYLYSSVCCLATVNETTGTVTSSVINF
jgi:3',5'-cyclic-AMP phosphodiesterase